MAALTFDHTPAAAGHGLREPVIIMSASVLERAQKQPRGIALGMRVRYLAAALAAVAAVVHLALLPSELTEARYLGVLFAGFAAVSLALAARPVRRDSVAAWRAGFVLPLVALVTYAVSRTVGLPAMTTEVGDWADPLGAVAAVAELALALLSLAVLTGRSRPSPEPGWTRLQVATAVAVLGLGVVATTTAAAAGPQSRTGATGSSMAADDDYWSSVGGATVPAGGVNRVYYVGADEVAWNYAPTGRNEITGEPFDEVARTYVARGPDRIGSTYLKCLYRGYTDAGFGSLAARAATDAYLGFLGPVIRAEVGDTITVVFRNGCRMPTSVHPHGVFYAKGSEGAPYADGTSGTDKVDDAVPQGGRATYSWKVPVRAGPGPHDGSSVMWMYHSHTDEVGDTYAGLMGPMVITAKGSARPDGSPKDVDREVFELFSVMNENKSPYLAANLAAYTTLTEPPSGPAGEEFTESNLMHSVNGYVFGGQPMLTLTKGQRVRWYVMGMGTEVDLHTPHWHGNDVVVGGMRMDVINLLPASMVTADMGPDSRGIWLFHCHVNDHLTAGMVTRYEVD